jgi:glyoxalase family protein
MNARLRSLHHVTATVTDAQEDLDFYSGLLGLRLIKKTVNFDNPGVYHLYYGDEQGTPSTIWTTFPYGGKGVPAGTKGTGQITVTSLSVPPDSLGFWRERLSGRGVAFEERPARFGEVSIALEDPSGLHIELIEGPGDVRTPWRARGIDSDAAVRGIHGVTITVRSGDRSVAFLTEVLGFHEVERDASRTRLATGPGGPGTYVEVLDAPDAPEAVNGLGTVHHVAFAISDAEEQLRVREILLDLGHSVTEVRDRQYFRSIYFREPGGVLYEIATLGPGFLVDEEVSDLGRGLRLPPWEEPNRPSIEAGLPPVSTRPTER